MEKLGKLLENYLGNAVRIMLLGLYVIRQSKQKQWKVRINNAMFLSILFLSADEYFISVPLNYIGKFSVYTIRFVNFLYYSNSKCNSLY